MEIADKYGIPYELASVMVPSGIIYKKLLDFTNGGKSCGSPRRICATALAVDYSERVEKFVLSHDFERDILNCVSNMTKKFESSGGAY